MKILHQPMQVAVAVAVFKLNASHSLRQKHFTEPLTCPP